MPVHASRFRWGCFQLGCLRPGRRAKIAASAVVGALAAFVAVRFVYVATVVDPGWSIVAERWTPAMLDRSQRTAESVALLEPSDQADFWLRHVDRIVAGEGRPAGGNQAQLAMGGAWLLDAPSPHYRARHIEPPSLAGLPPTLADTGQAEQVFEVRCGSKCLELARRATQIEPANVDWWRMRAVLTYAIELGGPVADRTPRTSDWLSVLDEAAAHDPDNALYDYLAATRLWAASGDYRLRPGPLSCHLPADQILYTVGLRDARQFAAGAERFDRGQKKKRLAFGDAGLPAVFEFLRHSGQPPAVQAQLATGSLYLLKASDLIVSIVGWQTARIDDCASAGEAAEALRLARQCLHVLAQVEAADETASYQILVPVFRQQLLTRTLGLVKANEGLVTAEEQAELTRDLREAKLRFRVWREAGNRHAPPPAAPRPLDVVELAALAFTPKTVTRLLIGGLLVWLASALVGRRCGRLPTLAIWQYAVAWTAVYGLAFAVLGMAPAGVIPDEDQPWIALGAAVGAMGLVGFVLWRSRFRFTLRAVLVTTFVCAVLFIPLACFQRAGLLTDVGSSLKVLPHGAGRLDAATLQSVLRIAPQSWTAAVWQFVQYNGFFYGAVVSPLVVVVWSAVRRSGSWAADGQVSPRAWWAALFRDAGRSALALAALLLLTDLGFTPRWLRQVEAKYEQSTLFFRHPEEGCRASRAAIAAVEGDAQAMDALRAAVDGP